MPIQGEGLVEPEDEQGQEQGPVTYVLHPNCAIEEM